MNSKKKILILNGSHSEIPLIRAAKNLNLHVITTGNAPSLIGHTESDEYHPADFSNKEEVLNLAKKLDIDYICSSANDFGAITSAYVAEKLGLPGHDNYQTALTVHHKDQFKAFSKQTTLPTPIAESFSDPNLAKAASDSFSLPLIVKPIDMTGGKGVSIVEDKADYIKAIDLAFDLSRAKRIVVEPFFRGTQHSFSAFIVNQKIVQYFSDDELSFLNPYLVSTSCAPASNIERFLNPLKYTIEKMAHELNLVDGIVHTQYLAKDDAFTIIEITRRCSGDLYPLPVKNACGVDWASWILSAECGFNCKSLIPSEQTGFGGRHCIMAQKNGVIENIQISDELKPFIVEEYMWWEQGQIIDNFLSQKFGVLILEYPDRRTMESITKQINNLILIDML